MSAHGWAQRQDAEVETTPDATTVQAPTTPRLGPPPVYYPPGQQLSSDTLLAPVVPVVSPSRRLIDSFENSSRPQRARATVIAADPVETFRPARIIAASLLAGGLDFVCGYFSIRLISDGISGRSGGSIGGGGLLFLAANLVAVPALYTLVSAGLEGNTPYSFVFGAHTLGLVASGTVLVLTDRLLASQWIPVAIGIELLLLVGPMILTYELSTASGHQRANLPGRRPDVTMTQRRPSMSMFPRLLLNETQRGITFGGVF